MRRKSAVKNSASENQPEKIVSRPIGSKKFGWRVYL